jgi:RNA polymerase sigma-54 factor
VHEEGVPNGNSQVLPAPNDHAQQVFRAALHIVQNLDPIGIATRDLRECLLVQIAAQQREVEILAERLRYAIEEEDLNVPIPSDQEVQEVETRRHILAVAHRIVDCHLALLQRRDLREIAKSASCSSEQVQQALDFIRTLDPRPGQRYNRSEARLIEPDVAFVKRDNEYVVVMNEEDLPTLRLSQRYRRLLSQGDTTKDVKDYVKERYRSALQLMRNIEQRKNTILRTCESIVRRQQDFLELGMDALKPMMIKEVAEEIGVHPSTVSRAVSNKYVHTPQGVFELRFFFSEGVNGPEGAGTPLLLLKRKVKKLIEEEDPRKPLTDDQIAAFLHSQGISVTRRTVAKYREDMNIPSTHQRRKRD